MASVLCRPWIPSSLSCEDICNIILVHFRLYNINKRVKDRYRVHLSNGSNGPLNSSNIRRLLSNGSLCLLYSSSSNRLTPSAEESQSPGQATYWRNSSGVIMGRWSAIPINYNAGMIRN